jgi:hypothetical protein
LPAPSSAPGDLGDSAYTKTKQNLFKVGGSGVGHGNPYASTVI